MLRNARPVSRAHQCVPFRACFPPRRAHPRLVVNAKAPGWTGTGQKNTKGSARRVEFDDRHQSASHGFLPVEDHEARWMSNSPLYNSHAHEERPLTYAAAEEVYGRRPSLVVSEDDEERSSPRKAQGTAKQEQQASAAIVAEQRTKPAPWRRDTYFCTFRWPASLKGTDVGVIGSFNNWEAPIPLGKTTDTGDFVRTVALPAGTYQYKYLVDGQWLTSPIEPTGADDSGHVNNQRHVVNSVQFVWKQEWGGSEVFVIGDFTAWGELLPMEYDAEQQQYILAASLPPGNYSYQFLVDGQWQVSPDAAVAPDDDGHMCNKIEVKTPPAFHIFYATGWEDSRVIVRQVNKHGQPLPGEEWRELPMYNTRSRARPQGGFWKSSVVPMRMTAAAAQLQFRVTNGHGAFDPARHEQYYTCTHPGGFKLQGGQLRPFRQATDAPYMLVADLDGTMVETNNHEAEGAMGEFCRYWEDNAVLRGGVLVYNTGRSLGQFTHLYADKRGKLALPDVLITAVGTKIFMLDTTHDTRRNHSGAHWKEDREWAALLNEGWDLKRVRSIARRVLDRHHNDAHWLDEGHEHPHRIALSVNVHQLQSIIDQLRDGLHRDNVQAHIITSGMGDWRYVDCVAINGGKYQALEYIRNTYRIPKERCMAAGDSGNDILMLQGGHPSVVVGNAQPELVNWLVEQPQQDSQVLFAEGMFARGIIEGLARHGLY